MPWPFWTGQLRSWVGALQSLTETSWHAPKLALVLLRHGGKGAKRRALAGQQAVLLSEDKERQPTPEHLFVVCQRKGLTALWHTAILCMNKMRSSGHRQQ